MTTKKRIKSISKSTICSNKNYAKIYLSLCLYSLSVAGDFFYLMPFRPENEVI